MSTLKKYHSTDPFVLESGESIDDFTLAYHTFGTLNAERDNVIWAFHAFTANSNVLDWWNGLFGQDCLFNPEEHFIVCANIIGSPYGTSAPVDTTFPKFTVRDIVKANILLAKELDIHDIAVVIGGSFGGNQALEFAQSFTGRINQMVLVASCAKESAWSIAVHETQRMTLKADKTFGSLAGGIDGLKAARAIGMLTYRTADGFIDNQTDDQSKTEGFKASSYIQYQGQKFAKRFTALSYYYLLDCMDTHDIGRGRGGLQKALKAIEIPTLVVSIASDVLIPPRLQQELAAHLPNATYQEIASDFGHDGFLIETTQLTQHIEKFLIENKQQKASNAEAY